MSLPEVYRLPPSGWSVTKNPWVRNTSACSLELFVTVFVISTYEKPGDSVPSAAMENFPRTSMLPVSSSRRPPLPS